MQTYDIKIKCDICALLVQKDNNISTEDSLVIQ